MLYMEGKTLLCARYVKDELSSIGCRVYVFGDTFKVKAFKTMD